MNHGTVLCVCDDVFEQVAGDAGVVRVMWSQVLASCREMHALQMCWERQYKQPCEGGPYLSCAVCAKYETC